MLIRIVHTYQGKDLTCQAVHVDEKENPYPVIYVEIGGHHELLTGTGTPPTYAEKTCLPTSPHSNG